MTTILYILLAILMFGVLILVHEWGHFITAKKLGVQVNEFAIGMGPVLWKRQKGETQYSIRAFPVGGFCAMEGEDEDNDNPRGFHSVSWWRRVIILVAGSFMNFVAGFLMVAALLSTYSGFTTLELTGFYDNGGLQEQGLQVGDTLYALDGHRQYLTNDLSLLTARTGDGYYDLTIVRDGQKMVLKDFHLFQDTYEYEGQETYGYGILLGYESKNVGSVLKDAWYICLDFVRMVRMGLEDLITGAVGIKDMSGPVGIVDVIADTGNASPTVTIGLLNILYLAAFIAVNLAVMNLLPLPALDGGRVVCLLLTTVVEKVTRRHINPKYEGYLHGVGMVLLLVLMVYVSFQDVFRIIGG